MSTTSIKIIALIAMLIDHIGLFLPNTPEWLGWIGRIAATIFIFGVVVGYQHTSDRRKYITRLYFFAVGMAVLNVILNLTATFYMTYFFISTNFFAPLFLICIIIWLIDVNVARYWMLFISWQVISTVICFIVVEFLEFPDIADLSYSYLFLGSIFGNIFFVEGGFVFVIIGIALYIAKESKLRVTITYTVFSVLVFMLSYLWGESMDPFASYLIPFSNYQWMMIFALPIILLYNGKRGFGLKHFFYIFYPAHILILYLIGLTLQ